MSNRRVIFGGDFNCILNSRYDKIGKGSNPNYGNVGSKELTNLCNDYILCDIFRHLHPHQFATTWHASASKNIHTRLDRFYISKSMISDGFDFFIFIPFHIVIMMSFPSVSKFLLPQILVRVIGSLIELLFDI